MNTYTKTVAPRRVKLVQEEYKKVFVIEQLEKYGYKADPDMSYKDLVQKLSMAKALEVEAESPHSSWF